MLYGEWFTMWYENNREFYDSIGLDVLQRIALSRVYEAAFDKEVANQALELTAKSRRNSA